MMDGQKEVRNLNMSRDELVVEWKYKSSHVREPKTNNLFVAVCVTAMSRVHLYKALASAGRSAIYTDTDSLIAQKSIEDLGLPISANVGDFSSELAEGDSIATVICGGSKNYSYRTRQNDVVTKVRGFTLSHRASQVINHEAMKNLMLNNPEGQLETLIPDQIFRDKNNFKLYSRDMKKVYTMVNDKRVYLPDHTSRPYGYYHTNAPDIKLDRYYQPVVPEVEIEKYRYMGAPLMGNEADDLE